MYARLLVIDTSGGGVISDILSLSKEFQRVHDDERELKALDYNLSMTEDGALNAGRIPTNATPDKYNLKKEDKEEEKLVTLLMRLEHARIWLQQRITQLQQDIDKLLQDRDQVTSTLNALVEFHEHYMKTGRFELDENGLPLDPLVRQAIKDWEQQTDREFNIEDENAPELLAEMLEKQASKIEQLNHNILQKNEQLEWRIEQLNDLVNADLDDPEEQSYAAIQLSAVESDMKSTQTCTTHNTTNSNQLAVKLNL